ncbi:MAG: uracil-DNA glycosylase [Acidobacteria bacterium]|nr:MAG: uracil-DNA glycosylase [Acidobacteriota bacterium]
MPDELTLLQQSMVECRLCPRLVEFREEVAAKKRAAYRDWDYWGKPVPSLGSADARLLIVGLAPAAHGGNRTGRVFTGDRSGDFLFGTLHRFGFATQASSETKDDGLELRDAYITAAVHCAPPGNRPLPDEFRTCRRYLKIELTLLKKVRVVVALGRIAWQEIVRARKELNWPLPNPMPPFGHAAMCCLDENTVLICSYHPSQQNTSTGKLTQPMFDEVFRKARTIIGDNRG